MKHCTRLYRLIQTTYFVVFSIICILLIFANQVTYYCKKEFSLSNPTLLLIDFFIVAMICVLIFIIRNLPVCKKWEGSLKQSGSYFVINGTIMLFLLQVFISYQIYFMTGWDSGYYIILAAKELATNHTLASMSKGYFSRFTNNTNIVSLYSFVYQICNSIGVSIEVGLMPLIVINCLISSFSGYLLYRCAAKIMGKIWGLITWIIYFFFVGLSAWIVIPYTDSLGLLFPILVIYLYVCDLPKVIRPVKWLLISFFSFFGYSIKPQAIIVFIALCIIELFCFIANAKLKKMHILVWCIAGFGIFLIVNSFLYTHTGFRLNKEKEYGLTHFAMMGANEKTDGVFCQEDSDFSARFKTKKERTAANLKQIKNRYQEMGVIGCFNFLGRKTLVNYNDGTFAWGMEGEFYLTVYPEKNQTLSPLLRNIYYQDGTYYSYLSTVQQAVWLGLLFFSLGVIGIKKNELNNQTVLLFLSILGLTLFELIFEARARYLYLYAPIYVLAGIVGLKTMVQTCISTKVLFDK